MAKKAKAARKSRRSATADGTVPAPKLAYRPQDPQIYRPGIGLIGCGSITREHLAAYRKAGYRVLALCDLIRQRAKQRQTEFFPDASIYTDHDRLLARDDIEVVDITTHPPERPALVTAALEAGKHVLSQKPFVLDLDEGQRLADLADRQGVRLAVNQNGRWAPHFSYLRQVVAHGLIGALSGVHFAVHWDHSWVGGTVFEEVRHLILYDFAIHWFDLLCCLMGPTDQGAPAVKKTSSATGPKAAPAPALEPTRVYASFTRSRTQTIRAALLGQALVEYDGAQATLVFDGDTKYAPYDTTYVTGSHGTVTCQGRDVHQRHVTLTTAAGTAQPNLRGDWFPDGFHGTMGELLSAIEQGREPTHSARNNLKSLELCFAAVASAERHKAVTPGSVRRMPAPCA